MKLGETQIRHYYRLKFLFSNGTEQTMDFNTIDESEKYLDQTGFPPGTDIVLVSVEAKETATQFLRTLPQRYLRSVK